MTSEREEHYCTSPIAWSLAPRYSGREQCEPGHRWSGIRDHFLLHYIISGEGEIRHGRKWTQAGAGEAFVLKPDALMDYRASATDPWTYTWVGYAGLAAKDIHQQVVLPGSGPVVSLRPGNRVEEFMAHLVRALREKRPGFLWRAAGLLSLVLSEAIAFRADWPNGTAPFNVDTVSLVHQARLFIAENYNRYIDVSDVVAYIGLDRSYLGRRFKDLVGLTLQQFLEHTRMERAHALIVDTALPVSRVAASVGYRSYEVFERAFRRTFQTTPRGARQGSSSQ